MIAALALLVQAAAPAVLPADWSTLPVFPLPRASQIGDGVPFVQAEIAAGRCRIDPTASSLAVSTAILVGPGGRVVRIVPRAMDCPTVEQFTAGLLISLTRAGPGSAVAPRAGWYQLSVRYAW